MAFQSVYTPETITREALEQMVGPVLVEFGTNWCGFCQKLQPDLEAALSHYPTIQHLKIEDGQGRALGRSFRVKLWPSLVFMRDGHVVNQMSRPAPDEVEEGLKAITAPVAPD